MADPLTADPSLLATGGMNPNILGPILALLAGMIVIFLIVGIALYIYMGLTLMTVAKRSNVPKPWLAWVPIGNMVLMATMARMAWWPVLLLPAYIMLLFIPLIGPFLAIIALIVLIVYSFIWQWKICELRKRPGWWAILQIIPFLGVIWALIMWGILAWDKD